jgi:16S rRNA (adenine1518-N6/adenine1519-N6)-dimethyltransferase
MLAKKRFGQNFLHDKNIIQKIIAAINPLPTDHFVEIGPGRGALTSELLPLVNKLDAIELDRDLLPILGSLGEGKENFNLIHADALEYSLQQLATKERLRIVGNLPYNISTPIIFHFLEQIDLIQDMHFMLQKEVAERMAANPGSKVYGRLSVMVQYFCEVKLLIKVKPAAFFPVPKVDSVFLRLTPHLPIKNPAKNLNKFSEIVKQAFSQRRKTIQNSLQKFISKEQLQSLNINPQLRPEQMSVEEFIAISNLTL